LPKFDEGWDLEMLLFVFFIFCFFLSKAIKESNSSAVNDGFFSLKFFFVSSPSLPTFSTSTEYNLTASIAQTTARNRLRSTQQRTNYIEYLSFTLNPKRIGIYLPPETNLSCSIPEAIVLVEKSDSYGYNNLASLLTFTFPVSLGPLLIHRPGKIIKKAGWYTPQAVYPLGLMISRSICVRKNESVQPSPFSVKEPPVSSGDNDDYYLEVVMSEKDERDLIHLMAHNIFSRNGRQTRRKHRGWRLGVKRKTEEEIKFKKKMGQAKKEAEIVKIKGEGEGGKEMNLKKKVDEINKETEKIDIKEDDENKLVGTEKVKNETVASTPQDGSPSFHLSQLNITDYINAYQNVINTFVPQHPPSFLVYRKGRRSNAVVGDSADDAWERMNEILRLERENIFRVQKKEGGKKGINENVKKDGERQEDDKEKMEKNFDSNKNEINDVGKSLL
jgi:hypothetical protein